MIASAVEAVLITSLCRILLFDVHSGDIAVQLKHGLKEFLWEVHVFVGNERLQVMEHLSDK